MHWELKENSCGWCGTGQDNGEGVDWRIGGGQVMYSMGMIKNWNLILINE